MLSVVIPCHNEELALGPLVERLRPVLEAIDLDYEVVFVDDGSTDTTLAVLEDLTLTWPQVRICELARNAGHQAAITAGMDSALGDYIVTLDADLQDPPELITDMVKLAQESDLDVVYARRSSRRTDTFLKRSTARLYYSIIRWATGIQLIPDAGDYRLISRQVAEVLKRLPERRRVYRLLVPWLGFPSGSVEHERDERVAGETKYSPSKMFGLAFDSLTSFSTRPLHLATYLGLLTGGVSFVATLAVIVTKLLGEAVPGWASLSAAIFFLGSVQLVCIGVLGSYVGRIYEEVRHRPLYIVREPHKTETTDRS